MRTHTSGFKNEISKFGRQINARIYKYSRNYNLVDSNNLNIITEDEIQLISDNIETTSQSLIDSDDIYSIDIVKNGQLLQSLMKECDFESSVQLNVGDIINPELGVLVNNDFEYLNYGNYIVYSKEYVAENKTWRYVCYDKMLYSMVQYKPLNLTYPCTIREYLIALADRIGLNFANASDTFPNYNQDVLNELFEGQNVTYRDILDKLSQITASNILINDDDELELGYPSETSDTITEENLKDINVSFGEMFGPINKVSIIHDSVEYYAEDSQSVGQNGLTQINIVDNIFGFNGNSNAIAQSILNKIKGLAYSINDFTTTGVCYYDFLDLFNVSTQNSNYKCLLLNNEINITQGIKEQIFNQKPEHTEKESENYTTSVMNSKEVSFTLNAQKGEIRSKVEKDGVISAINQSAEQITIDANKIKLEGYTTINNGFGVDLNGNMTANGAQFNGGEISLQDSGDQTLPTFKIDSTNAFSRLYSTGFYFENTSEDNSIGFYGENEQDPSFEITLWGQQKVRVSVNGLWASAYQNMSLEETKKNFEKLNNAIDIIKQIDIYKYNLKSENDKTKKHIGLVIGDKYNYSKEITSNDNESVDIYSFISVCCKAIQEQQEQIEALQKRIENLEKEVK